MLESLIGSAAVIAILSAIITLFAHAAQVSSYASDRTKLAEQVSKARIILRSTQACNDNFQGKTLTQNALEFSELKSTTITYDPDSNPIKKTIIVMRKNDPADQIKIKSLRLQMIHKLDTYRFLASLIISSDNRGDFKMPLGVVVADGKVLGCFRSASDIMDTDPTPPGNCADESNKDLPECENFDEP